ncbi:hypothetical protein M514_19595 [Trichuris suis]|uniref:Uncharacterized protein n=1 Tax=Trichuris suis TaxID=68888 RepID=A0A085NF67_9BILA|nr:hypothetical protein M514_19595 [Trichuris suis]
MANSPNLISGVGSRFMVRYTLLGQFNNLWHMHLSAQENYYVTFVCLSDDGVFTRLEYSRNSIIGKRTSDVQVTTVLGYSSTARTTDCLCNAKVQTTTKIKLHAMREADYPPLYHMNQSACAELTNQDNIVWKWYFYRTFGSARAPQF